MTTEIVRKSGVGEFAVENLPRNDSIWLRVENFDLLIKRTDEGIVVDLFRYREDGDYVQDDLLGSTYAFDSDTED